MFDVLHNVFGKKKAHEPGKSPDTDDFVILEKTANDRTVVRDTDVDPNDMPPRFPNSPYGGLPYNVGSSTSKDSAEFNSVNIMSLQDVPFTLNSALNVSKMVDQIWQSVAPCMVAITQPASLQMEYDFSLERSVVSETSN